MDIMMSMRDRGNTDRTKDKKISYLGGIPVRLVHPGRPRCKVLTPVPPIFYPRVENLDLRPHSNTNEERESGTGVSSSCFPSSPRAFCPVMARRNCSKPLDLRSTTGTKFQHPKRLGCPPVHQKQGNASLSARADRQPVRTTDLDLAKSLW